MRIPARAIALTFNACSERTGASETLDVLRHADLRATFFLTGAFIGRYPELVRRMADEGHEIGNHTNTHPLLAESPWGRTREGITRARLHLELREPEQAFEKVTGQGLSPLWRSPYGMLNLDLVGYAFELGYTHVHWTLNTCNPFADPRTATRRQFPYRTAGRIRNLVLRRAKAGDILLMHLDPLRPIDRPWEGLREVVAGLRQEGFDLVTVSELLGGHARSLPILPPGRSKTSHCVGGETENISSLPSSIGMTPSTATAAGRIISVIIPTYGRPLALRQCIASLARQEYPTECFEVVVVDDGSEPPATVNDSGDPSRHVQVSLIRQPNRGVAAARAAGIAHARGHILAFLDDDCTVPPGYLESIDRVFRMHPETQVVQVGLHNPEPGNIYGRAWKYLWDETLRINMLAASDGRLQCGNLGGVMVARRDVFTEVAFDTAINPAREDADLLYQLRLRGIPVYYEPRIRVFHHCRHTLRRHLAQYFGYGRGEFHLRRKWGAIPPPTRYGRLASWRQLRALLKAEGVPGGLKIACMLWLKSHASLWGLSYETVAVKHPGRRNFFWARFGWQLLRSYARHAARLCRRIVGRLVSARPGDLPARGTRARTTECCRFLTTRHAEEPPGCDSRARSRRPDVPPPLA